jgi:ribosomal-protein-alanine N-acetyltransferase
LRTIQSTLAEPWPELLETATQGPPPLYVVWDGPPVGYATVVGEDGVAYTPDLAVHPDRQGEGLGSELLAWLRAHLDDEGYTELRLTVQASDERARSFYDQHGFETIERLNDHFERGDGLLLGRSLSE